MPEEKKPANLPLSWVKAADPERTGVWERDNAHPGGEVLVNGTQVVQVAETPLVLLQLQNGSLVRVGAPTAAAAEEEPKLPPQGGPRK